MRLFLLLLCRALRLRSILRLRETNRKRVATLYVVGGEDGCMTPEYFAVSVPTAATTSSSSDLLIRVPEAGHWVHHDKPKRVHQLLTNWLQRH